ncbi:pancreatic triacylglycerol lipase-like isoform X2 [Bradysia coprophila]|uniref:pancreatic triacylglycerol lipase-like isoform X2 n=1 Tax=Bradysia coprophila TaxID=38358 RepID=UPI00187DCD40|nr:pancreatic triacylglycerol lipase-like isoform X2 [Bradysia coprophila]
MSPIHRNFLIFFFFCKIKNFGAPLPPLLSDDELGTVVLYYNSPFITSEQIISPNVSLVSFAPDLPTKLIIHGYIANRFHGSIEPVKNAYLGRGDVNVLLVDWEQLAHKLYDESRSYVRQIGSRIGNLLSHYIRNQNVSYSDIHVIGHSLGKIERTSLVTLEDISTVTLGAPLFTNSSIDAIKQSDGQFVDIIHTCGYSLGEIWARGHIDFYPNSGKFHQPGCRKDDLLQLFSCSHFRAPLFYAESILFPYSFTAAKCTFREIMADSPNKCTNSNENVYMGDIVSMDSRGLYYLTTNEMYPFGRGNYSQYGIL